MRALLVILILVILVAVAAVATGFVNINLMRGGSPPQVSASRNGVTAKGGQPPAFAVETGSVKVGTTQATVNVPTVVVEKPGRKQAPNNNAQ
jgi:hypothetical protein